MEQKRGSQNSKLRKFLVTVGNLVIERTASQEQFFVQEAQATAL